MPTRMASPTNPHATPAQNTVRSQPTHRARPPPERLAPFEVFTPPEPFRLRPPPPRGSRSSRDGPAAMVEPVYPRADPVQESSAAARPSTGGAMLSRVAEPGQPLIRAEALSVGYGGVPILPPITVPIAAGELWAVIGPNGAGKSTFVRTLLGLERPVGGSVQRARDVRLGYVPQQGALDPIFPVSVLDFVLMGRQGPGNVVGRTGRADAEAAAAALSEAGVRELARRQLR